MLQNNHPPCIHIRLPELLIGMGTDHSLLLTFRLLRLPELLTSSRIKVKRGTEEGDVAACRKEFGERDPDNGAAEPKLAASQERYSDLERRKEEALNAYSPTSLLQKLHTAMNEIDEESESLRRQLLNGEVQPRVFLQKYKELRTTYHRRVLLHLAAKTSVGNG